METNLLPSQCLRRQGRLALLLGWGLLSLLGCRPAQDERLTPQPTGQLARLQEWSLYGPVSQSGAANLTDTLNFLAIDGSYYYIQYAVDSRFQYDDQRRLRQQTVNGYRNDSDYGRTQSVRTHQYRYSSTQLSILTTVNWLASGSGPASFTSQQDLTLNPRGLVERQPQLGNVYSTGDNGYSGISQLFTPCLNPGLPDSLRRYDTQGYLLGALTSFVPSWSEPWQLTQSIVAGNVVNRQLQPLKPTPIQSGNEPIRWVMQYDLGRPTIPNPHPFLGSVSRNLPTTILYYTPTQRTPWLEAYRYEYDASDRVMRYFISRQEQGVSTLHTIGKLTYEKE